MARREDSVGGRAALVMCVNWVSSESPLALASDGRAGAWGTIVDSDLLAKPPEIVGGCGTGIAAEGTTPQARDGVAEMPGDSLLGETESGGDAGLSPAVEALDEAVALKGSQFGVAKAIAGFVDEFGMAESLIRCGEKRVPPDFGEGIVARLLVGVRVGAWQRAFVAGAAGIGVAQAEAGMAEDTEQPAGEAAFVSGVLEDVQASPGVEQGLLNGVGSIIGRETALGVGQERGVERAGARVESGSR